MKKTIVVALALAFAGTHSAYADDTADLKAKLEALQHQMDALKTQLDKVTREQHEQKNAPAAPTGSAGVTPGYTPVEVKNGDNTVFKIGNHEVQVYGNLDVSVDSSTKGFPSGNSPGAVGKLGWQADLSTNLSYIGVRGKHSFDSGMDFVYQLETQIDISATAGTTNTTSSNDTTVKGALTSRNSYIGLASDWGAVKFGKSDAPYKNATARFNPFSGMLGDYSVIMGNTGGDNRVEFGTRMDHAMWYESPNWSGFHANLLYAPGQNRSTDSSVQASGESSCAGGNAPGSGALPPSCNDGAWDSAYSAALTFEHGPVYLAAAYEMHRQVNRSSDVPTATFPDGDPNDIGNESAWKIAGEYKFASTGTTVGAIFERTRRDIPGYLEFQNERTRPHATWLVVSQDLGNRSSVHFGWAHAGATPGDPGQHNTPGGAGPDNSADMFTLAYKHAFDRHFSWYADWAATMNHFAAHYDLGAGGRGVTTDCHDGSNLAAFDPTTGAVIFGGPHCYAGGHLQGVSVGLKYVF